MAELIGPLTAEEWCSLRLGGNADDVLMCCGETSAFRDAVFMALRMGGDRDARFWLLPAWRDLVEHGLPTGPGTEVIAKLRDYYDLPAGLPAI